jgi:hypothetical protein
MLRLLLLIIGFAWGSLALLAKPAAGVQTLQVQQKLLVVESNIIQLNNDSRENEPQENPYLCRYTKRSLRRSSHLNSFWQKNWFDTPFRPNELLQVDEYQAHVLFLGKPNPLFSPALHPAALAIHRYHLF